MTWKEATNACSSMKEGVDLVFTESKPENRKVPSLAKVASEGQDKPWWIGLTDGDTEGTWKWYNISLGYKYWKHSEPNNNDVNQDSVEPRQE